MTEQIFESMAERLQKDVLCHIAYTYSAFIPKDTESIRSKMKSTIYMSDRVFLDYALRAKIGNQVIFPYDVLIEKINTYINDFYAELALSGETLKRLSKYGERADIFKKQFNDNLEKSKATTINAVEKNLHTLVMLDMDAKAVMKHMKKLMSSRTDAVKRLLEQSNGQMEKYMLLWDYQDMGYTRYRLITNGDTCEDCTSLNGKIFSVDKAESGKNFPPIHPNCDCTFEIVDEQGNSVVSTDERAEKEKDDKLGYLSTSLKQIVLGNYTDDVTLLGTIGQIVLGLIGVDLPADIRDLFYDVTNWENTKEHILQTALDSVAIVPIIGGLKYTDEAADLIQLAAKHRDEASDAVKAVNKTIEKLPWNSWESYEKVELNNQIYAKIGNRLYSKHAVNRMQPSGNRFGPNIYQELNGVDYGRSIGPQYIEDVINSSKAIFQPETGNYVYTSGTVKVVLNPQGAVVTVITYINKGE